MIRGGGDGYGRGPAGDWKSDRIGINTCDRDITGKTHGLPHPRALKCDRGHQYCTSCWRGEKCERGRIFGAPESNQLERAPTKNFSLDPGSGSIPAAQHKRRTKSRVGPRREAKRIKSTKMIIEGRSRNPVFYQ